MLSINFNCNRFTFHNRPSTAFNAFGFDGGDEGSGSHGFFGGLDEILENTNDDDEAMMVD